MHSSDDMMLEIWWISHLFSVNCLSFCEKAKFVCLFVCFRKIYPFLVKLNHCEFLRWNSWSLFVFLYEGQVCLAKFVCIFLLTLPLYDEIKPLWIFVMIWCLKFDGFPIYSRSIVCLFVRRPSLFSRACSSWKRISASST